MGWALLAPHEPRRAQEQIVACRRCPRLVEWREEVAKVKRAAYRDETYWGRPVPGLRRPEGEARHRGPRARRPRREPHRPHVHRRSQRRVPLRRPAPRRLREPAAPAPRATTASSSRAPSSPRRCAACRPTTCPTPARDRDAAAPSSSGSSRCCKPKRLPRARGIAWAAILDHLDWPRAAARVRAWARCSTRPASSAATTSASRTRRPGRLTPRCSMRS